MTRIRSTVLLAAVLVLAACGSDASAGAPDGDELRIVSGEMFFEPTQLTAQTGTVEITLVNEGATRHDLVIEELGDLEVVPLVDAGDTVSGSVALEAGTYTFYCSVPGHRGAGMEGTLTSSG